MYRFVLRPRDNFKFPTYADGVRHLENAGYEITGSFIWGNYACPLGSIFPDGGGFYSVKSAEGFREARNRLIEAVEPYNMVEEYVPPADSCHPVAATSCGSVGRLQ